MLEEKSKGLEREVAALKEESERAVSEIKASHAKDLAAMLARMEALEAAAAAAGGSTRHTSSEKA